MTKSVVSKYWLIIFVVCNICAQYYLTSSIANYLFYFLQIVAAILIISYAKFLFLKNTIKRFPFVYWYAIILLGYQFTFGLFFISDKTWTYLIAKILVDFAIIISLSKNFRFYEKEFYPIIALITSIFLIFGYLTHNTVFSGRQTLGFWNPNSTGSISAICFGTVFIMKSIKLRVRYVVAAICLLGVLLSGSRSAMGIVIISLFIKYGFNYKLIGFSILMLFVVFVLLPAMDIQFIGISRFSDAIVSNDFTSGREIERESTKYMIRESPWVGNGIYSQQDEEASKISTLGSHNAFLDFLKWFGYPIGLFLISIILFYVLRLYILFRNTTSPDVKAHLFVIVGVLLAANYEAYIWGVNQMITTMFFLSLSLLQKKYYDLKYLRLYECKML